MKVKTSITLSEELLRRVDRAAGTTSRSAFIEAVLQGFLRERALEEEQRRDRRLLDAAAERLNREVEDVLDYQAPGPEYED